MLATVLIGVPLGISQMDSVGSTNTAGLLVGMMMVLAGIVLSIRALHRLKQRAAERILHAVLNRDDVYWTYEDGEMVGHDARGPRVRLSLVAALALPDLPAASARMRNAADLQRA